MVDVRHTKSRNSNKKKKKKKKKKTKKRHAKRRHLKLSICRLFAWGFSSFRDIDIDKM